MLLPVFVCASLCNGPPIRNAARFILHTHSPSSRGDGEGGGFCYISPAGGICIYSSDLSEESKEHREHREREKREKEGRVGHIPERRNWILDSRAHAKVLTNAVSNTRRTRAQSENNFMAVAAGQPASKPAAAHVQ